MYRMFLSAVLCVGAIVLSTSTALADAYQPVPWLAGVTIDSVYVCLEATNATPATVEFGLTKSYGKTASTQRSQPTEKGRRVHNIPLTGLKPNTQYHYRVTHGKDTSEDYSFWTAPLPGTYARWGFAADTKAPMVSYAGYGGVYLHRDNAILLAAEKPRMMVYGGDLSNPGAAQWEATWFIPAQEALNATVPFVNATGNHENWEPLTMAYTESPDGTDGRGKGYFSFDYGDAHILILNTELSLKEGSDQWRFAVADLAATKRKFKVVAMHIPAYVRYLPGSYIYNVDGSGASPGLEKMAKKVFAPAGVNLVMGGDKHTYQHAYVDGVHHMNSPPFGLDARTGTYADWTVHAEDSSGYIIIETTSQTMTVTVYRGAWGPHGIMGPTGDYKTVNIHGKMKKFDYVCPDAGSVIETFTIGELPGDVNGDSRVDSLDAMTIIDNSGMKNPKRSDGDLNADGVIDKDDLQEARDNWSTDLPVEQTLPAATPDSIRAGFEKLRATMAKQSREIQKLRKELGKQKRRTQQLEALCQKRGINPNKP